MRWSSYKHIPCNRFKNTDVFAFLELIMIDNAIGLVVERYRYNTKFLLKRLMTMSKAFARVHYQAGLIWPNDPVKPCT